MAVSMEKRWVLKDYGYPEGPVLCTAHEGRNGDMKDHRPGIGKVSAAGVIDVSPPKGSWQWLASLKGLPYSGTVVATMPRTRDVNQGVITYFRATYEGRTVLVVMEVRHPCRMSGPMTFRTGFVSKLDRF